MAWGSFLKKIQNVGSKIISGARQAVDFAKTKILPKAKEYAEILAPFTPYGATIQKGLEMADDFVNKADEYTGMAENVRRGDVSGTLKQFVGKKVRV